MNEKKAPLSSLANGVERLSKSVGHIVAWGTLVMVITTALVVILRHVFQVGWIWLQEIAVYMHALVFLLGAAYTLSDNEHVRVDVFYRTMSRSKKRIVETIGTLLFLIPSMLFILWTSWSYVISSWATNETSHETGGLVYPFPSLLKTSILIASALLILQGLAMLVRLWHPPSSESVSQLEKDGDRSADTGTGLH